MHKSILIIAALLSLGVWGCAIKNDATAGQPITVATFNAEWLGDGVGDRKPRTAEHLQKMSTLLEDINADVLAMQEVEGNAAVDRLRSFLAGYDWRVTAGSGDQQVALLAKPTVKAEFVDAFTLLPGQENRTRPALLSKVTRGESVFFVLCVHFKSTSRYDSTDQMKDESRRMRSQQAERLVFLSDSIQKANAGAGIMILGDLNDFPLRKKYASLGAIIESKTLSFLTDSLENSERKGWYVIDHIVVNDVAKSWYVPGSAQVWPAAQRFSKEEKKNISDHEPVFAKFLIP